MLEHGAAVEGRAAAGMASPLLMALEAGHAAAAAYLVEAGADPDACLPESKESALHLAAARGLDDLLAALIGAGATFDIQSARHAYDDELGVHLLGTPLHVAALNDRAGAVALLLKAGAAFDSVTPDGRQPLHYAAARGALGAIEILLAAGADPDALDDSLEDGLSLHLSPLHYAILNAHAEAVALLLCYGADASQMESGSGETPLQMALQGGERDALVSLLESTRRREEVHSVFSRMDDCFLNCSDTAYREAQSFLNNLLAESADVQRSLLVLFDWLAQMLGAEQRPYLARAYRARMRA
ncbi:MAG: hypothetical protein CGU29_15270 [Candidatus Dactylopiibacterium carminicum]|uniref:Ankyrin repeat domain-containing protein n=2 Tax=Candidatus Dactylopiibacterium carminicum TaxID=857335 RepID=A0A272ENF4_9RHOO|nr:ankyrin repeat domain-containing protein [Candidatus Dactylopiibacterium carminicum]PAS91654.1 MAG: hypothetical protein CGU29_15270 [Candidatus Dactylopiibacterium carminicum]PAS99269.1 MAG: hypothetical protein BSR46_08760 [Candidatus Dactylopiibacterium carminicum]